MYCVFPNGILLNQINNAPVIFLTTQGLDHPSARPEGRRGSGDRATGIL
jgi:hypothetical protein